MSSRGPSTIRGLDGARGLAAVGIVITHTTGLFSPDVTARLHLNVFGFSLLFFFVLSGFLLYLPFARGLADRAEADAWPRMGTYAVHRILRIMPTYLVIFAVANFVFAAAFVRNPAAEPGDSLSAVGRVTDPATLLSLVTLVNSYIPAHFQLGLNVSWSLTLQFAFYAAMPALAWLAYRLHRRSSAGPLVFMMLPVGALLLVGLSGKAIAPYLPSGEALTSTEEIQWGPHATSVFLRSLACNGDSFALGMAAAVLFVALERGRVPERWIRWIPSAAVASAVLALFATAALLASDHLSGAETGFAAVAAALIVLVAAPNAVPDPATTLAGNSRIAALLDIAPLRALAEVSLSTYLWHYPVMIVLDRHHLTGGDTVAGMVWNVGAVLTVTVALSALTYFAVEKPAIQLARRGTR